MARPTASFTMARCPRWVFLMIVSVFLVTQTTAVPASVPSKLTPNFLNRGFLDIFSSKGSPSPNPSALPNPDDNPDGAEETSGVGDDSDPAPAEPEMKTPEPTNVEIIATPTPLELPLSEPTPTPYAESAESPSPSYSPQPLGAGADDGGVDEKDPSDPRSNPGEDAGVPSAAAGGVSVIALVVIAAVILVPVVLIYVGIRRRRNSGFENMPPTQQAHTYSGDNARTNFSVGDD